MNCQDVQQYLHEYWDLSETDPIRLQVDQHLSRCTACQEEFDIWNESRLLILDAGPITAQKPNLQKPITINVMDRIYTDEKWRAPLASKVYNFSSKLRRNAMIAMVLFVTIFGVSFVYSILDKEPMDQTAIQQLDGIFPVANAEGEANNGVIHAGLFDGIPVASISSPTVLKLGPIQTYPDYLLAVSIIGLIFTLLLLNWFSRIRA